jgi:hypothetical protein
LAGDPTAKQFDSIIPRTTLPAPIIAPSPIIEPGKIITCAPIQTSSPISTGSSNSIHG